MSVKTPILLIAWRRPDRLRELINAIRPAAPTRLFVACDGASPGCSDEAAKVEETHKVIDKQVTWPCQIERLYSDISQGTRKGSIRAISWFFDQVDEGIILEEDCIPDLAFFDYSEWALRTYRGNKSVMHINGSNFSAPSSLFRDEISFVSIPQIWGWASWSDRWALFEENPFYLEREMIPIKWALSIIGRLSKIKHLHALKEGLDAWDHQWQITILNHNGLVVCPRRNLISYVGIGSGATHEINDKARTYLRSAGFSRPNAMPTLKNNLLLTRFFEKKMGLSFRPGLAFWLCKTWLLKLRSFLRQLIVLIIFRNLAPVVIASTGRAGSTMLTNAVAFSLIQAKYSFFPSWVKTGLFRLSKKYVARLEDVGFLNRSPIIKTHDLFNEQLGLKFKCIFVYSDPLDAAVSTVIQGQMFGSAWLDMHIFHLRGKGSPHQILESDVLNYEGQLSSWQKSSAFFIHYSEIWSRRDELSQYLGSPLLLPPRRLKAVKNLPRPFVVNNFLFERLRLVEKDFRSKISKL